MIRLYMRPAYWLTERSESPNHLVATLAMFGLFIYFFWPLLVLGWLWSN